MDLSRGEAEVAIRIGRLRDPDLVARTLCTGGWSMYASPSYLERHPIPASPEDLSGHEVVGYDPRVAHTPGARWLEAHSEGAKIVLRGRESADVASAVLSGVGLSVLPCLFGETEPGLRRLTDRVLASHDVSLVFRPEAKLSESVRKVIDFVVETIAQHAAEISGQPSSSSK